MNKESLSRRDFFKRAGQIVSGVAVIGGGLEVMKASDDVSRTMSHSQVADALKEAAFDNSGPFVEPTVDGREFLGVFAGGALVHGGAVLLMEGFASKLSSGNSEDAQEGERNSHLSDGMIDENFVGPFSKE